MPLGEEMAEMYVVKKVKMQVDLSVPWSYRQTGLSGSCMHSTMHACINARWAGPSTHQPFVQTQ